MGQEPSRDRDTSYPGSFTDGWVKKTKGYDREVQYAERLKRGLSLMLYVGPLPRVTKTWRVIFYDAGRPRSKRIGTYPDMSLKQARDHALGVFNANREIASSKAGTFQTVSEDWIKEHVDERGLRTKAEIMRQLKTYVWPVWGKRPIFDIKRRDVNDLLRDIKRQIAKKRGAQRGGPQADAVLATIRNIMTWYAVYDDDYTPAVVPRMKNDKRESADKRRKRILTKPEIRAVWKACDDLPVYGDMLRLLLLTGQRLRKVNGMQRSDIVASHDVELQRDDGAAVVTFNNVWIVRTEKREKGNIGRVALPDMAIEIIKRQHVVAKNPHVFPADSGYGPINSFSQNKKALDEKVAALLPGMEPWVVHDLRRTVRSLLAELRVPNHIAEQVAGHKIKGVEGTYNRYDYFEEKSAALKLLEISIKAILNPGDRTNVANLADHAKARGALPQASGAIGSRPSPHSA